MNKCKDCELFKNGCGFSDTDEKLGLNGNFVACGQFVKSKIACYESCTSTLEHLKKKKS